jgi:hypothetical protein
MQAYDGMNRRRFLGALFSTTVPPLLIPAQILGRNGVVAPSERITVGIIGTGNQGITHARVLVALPEAQVVAVCDPVRARRLQARQLVDNWTQEPTGASRHSCKDYNDFRELLERSDIDAVFIASPEHWHAVQTVSAARAGKDIYCEKAMAKTVFESQEMVKAVRHHQRVFQLGTQQRSDRRFRLACELARNGYLGTLQTIRVGDPRGYPGPKLREEPVPEGLDYELWLGPAPYSPYCSDRLQNLKGWMLCYDYTVGFLSGWGQHDIDIAQWGNGTDHTTPVEIEVRLVFTSDDQNPHGIRFEGKEGWVFVDRSKIEAEPASLLTVAFRDTDTQLYRSDHHHLDFLRSVKSRKDPVSPVEAGHHTYVICNIGDIAARLGRRLRWEPEKERFSNDEQANQMLDRPRRGSWKL